MENLTNLNLCDDGNLDNVHTRLDQLSNEITNIKSSIDTKLNQLTTIIVKSDSYDNIINQATLEVTKLADVIPIFV